MRITASATSAQINWKTQIINEIKVNDKCSQTVTQNVPRQLLKWRGISRILPPCAIVTHSFCHHILHVHLKDHLWKVQQQSLHNRSGATTDIIHLLKSAVEHCDDMPLAVFIFNLDSHH